MSKSPEVTIQLFKCPACKKSCYYLCESCGLCASCCDCSADSDPALTQAGD